MSTSDLERENAELRRLLARLRETALAGAIFGVDRAFKNNDEPLCSTVQEKVRKHLLEALDEDTAELRELDEERQRSRETVAQLMSRAHEAAKK